MFKEYSEHKIIDDVQEKDKKERTFVITLETDSDPIQMRRDEKKWKQSLGYYLLHPNKFNFGLQDLK